ncbi:hypothetical protein [Fulvivirga lutimaris]|uniref:hypothetical protein n=1 Tax=Fulvivirga lutimaris TaxID=1819566 RepID=UPI0012BB803D|nr:hypothetical protein [Fulvivirga lutimaris]MTI41557.1 hypothetical protein [Fulvivirga lutimaris]
MKSPIIFVISFLVFSCGQSSKSEDKTAERDLFQDKSIEIESNVVTAKEPIDSITGSTTGTFYYDYPRDNKDFVEDSYIILDSSNNYTNSRFYGTTDEFDEAREGYLPAFTMCEINKLFLSQDSISFTINFFGNKLYNRPIDLEVSSHEQLEDSTSLKSDPWNFGEQSVNLTGKVFQDSLVIYSPVWYQPRSFIRIQ